MKVVLHVVRQPQGEDVLARIVEEFRLDYTALLQMTLHCWEPLEYGDTDILHAAIEGYLFSSERDREIKRAMNTVRYHDFQRLLVLATRALEEFHAAIRPIVQPLIEQQLRGRPVDIGLQRFFGTDYYGTDHSAVLDIVPRKLELF